MSAIEVVTILLSIPLGMLVIQLGNTIVKEMIASIFWLFGQTYPA